MKQITKGKEPVSLTTHRGQPHSNYDNYREKDDVRDSLCSEQRGICCYCMGAIQPDARHMKIEHFNSQEEFPEYQLVYANLLGACKGNEGEQHENTHCDTFKGSKRLSFYPPEKLYAIEKMVTYATDGTIGSTNSELQKEIDEVLNLNAVRLKNRRKAALEGFLDTMKKYNGKISKLTLEKWIQDWSGTGHVNKLRPYCMVVVFWLEKRLKRA